MLGTGPYREPCADELFRPEIYLTTASHWQLLLFVKGSNEVFPASLLVLFFVFFSFMLLFLDESI